MKFSERTAVEKLMELRMARWGERRRGKGEEAAVVEPIEPGERKPIVEPGERKPIDARCKSRPEREAACPDEPAAERGTAEASTHHCGAESGAAEAATHRSAAKATTYRRSAEATTRHSAAKAAARHSAAKPTAYRRSTAAAAGASAHAPLGICRR